MGSLSRYRRQVTLGILSVLFLLFVSSSTSPLTGLYHGDDSAFFMLVGKGMKRGLLPYGDFFDMKGPYLFVIEYVGQLICEGKWGIFLIQCLNLFASLLLVERVYWLFLGDRKESEKQWIFRFLITILPILLIAADTFQYGNLTEEYSLLPLLVCLYLGLSYLKKEDNRHGHPVKYGCIYGFMTGVLAFIRITNVAMVGAIVFAILVELLIARKYKNLFYNAIGFVVGIIIAVLPACLFFLSQGLLLDMIDQVFLFGFEYVEDGGGLFEKVMGVLKNWYRVPLLLFPILTLWVTKCRKRQYWILSVSSAVFLLVAIGMGKGYPHYYTLVIPHVVLGMVFMLESFGESEIPEISKLALRKCPERFKKSLIVLVCVFLIGLPAFLYRSAYCASFILEDRSEEHWDKVGDIISYVPEEERDQVYAFNVGSSSSWYTIADIMPGIRYCDWQEHYINMRPSIGQELASWLANEEGQNVKWIVTGNNYEIKSEVIRDVISQSYTIRGMNDKYTLHCFVGEAD